MQFIIFVTPTVPGPHCTDSWNLYWLQLLSVAEHRTWRQTKSFFLFLSKSLNKCQSSVGLGMVNIEQAAPKYQVWYSTSYLSEEKIKKSYLEELSILQTV